MAFFENYRRAQAKLTTREAVATLDYMDESFQAGSKWAQGVYTAENGARCLVAAANHCKVSAIDSAKYWLMQAIKERMPHLKSIEQFNDQAKSFAEIAAVIRRARELASAAQLPAVKPVALLPPPQWAKQLPAPAGARETLPAVRPAAPRPAPAIPEAPRLRDAWREFRASFIDYRD